MSPKVNHFRVHSAVALRTRKAREGERKSEKKKTKNKKKRKSGRRREDHHPELTGLLRTWHPSLWMTSE